MLKCLYTVLIVMSGIILFSAYIRLTMYEEAYGFTLSRVLAHVFMIYLIVIFVYTLIRVWLEKLPLLHFYIIVGIIFYTGLNAINLEQIDRKSTRLNSSHVAISYAVFCLQKKTTGPR